MAVRKLSILDKEKLISHLKGLQGEERRLRFGGVVTDDYITEYVQKTCGVENNKWFGVDHINGHLVAACHVAIVEDSAELGCSVDSEYRGLGYAQDMFDRSVTWLRTKGITDVCMHCLAENAIMKHIARKNDMAVVTDGGETDANVHLKPPTPLVLVADQYADRIAVYDMVFKNNIKMMRSFLPKYWYDESKSIT
jgi:RimJ/RimL family protein N-acetyltransferase